MLFKRENGRVDIDSEITNGNIVIDEEEQKGARPNKFWFNNYTFMYKDVYPSSHEDYAEIIAHKLAKHLDIPSASYDLATYNGKLGVITKNLVKDNENEELLSGAEIITQIYAEYIVPLNKTVEKYLQLINEYNAQDIFSFSKLPLEKQLELRNELIHLINEVNTNNTEISGQIQSKETIDFSEIENMYEYLNSFIDIYNKDFTEMKNGIIKANNLYDIWSVLEIYTRINHLDLNIEEFMDSLINMFIFDIITSQGDRHADNWSIIKNNGNNSIKLCPLYDNSNFCSLNREKAIKNIVDYVKVLNDPAFNEKKKQKIKLLLQSTINHTNSSLKVDLEDVEQKNKNRQMMEKFITFSSEEFLKKINYFTSQIDDSLLDTVFSEIEEQTKTPVPNDVKLIVKTVIFNNIEMINELCSERKMSR